MGSMKQPGWELRLHDAIEDARGRPFQWGSHDCATWAFDVAARLTGTESQSRIWLGRYRTAAGAERLKRRLGWSTRREGGEALLGAPLATPLLAQRGDIVLGPDEAFGICTGADAAFVGPAGLVFVKLAACAAAWRI